MDTQYTAISRVYDSMCGRDEDAWAKYLSDLLRANGVMPGALVLDCACGTGSVTAKLAEYGYDMTGFDASADMLSVAYENTAGKNVLLLCQDMTDFELYGSVAAALCSLDSLNYLPSEDGIQKFFSLVHNYLDPDGIFIFDINTPYKFENIYSDRDYIIEDGEGRMLCWSCDYDRAEGKCRFALSVFTPEGDGLWSRCDEEQFEYCRQPDMIEKMLVGVGFDIVGIKGELSDDAPSETEQRIHFICKKRN